MRIAHILSVFLPEIGGAQVCVHNTAVRHQEAGHEVFVVCPRGYAGVPARSYNQVFLAPASVAAFRWSYPLACAYLRAQLTAFHRRYRPDVYQMTLGYPFGAALAELFAQWHCPAILRCTGDDIQMAPELGYGMRLDPVVDRRIRKTYPRFSGYVAISLEVQRCYQDLGIRNEKIYKIPNGVDLLRFALSFDRRIFRQSLGVKENQTVILTVGRNHLKKGFKDILPVVQRLRQSGKNFVWWLVGSGLEPLAEEARGAGLGDHLRTFPAPSISSGGLNLPPDGLVSFYRGADIFVLPTRIETFGIVVVEALAAGLPVVTTTAPGVDELITENVNGYKGVPGDIDALTRALERLIDDPVACKAMGESARLSAESFGWDAVAAAYLDVYEKQIHQEPHAAYRQD